MGTEGKVFSLLKNGENGTVKIGYFVPLFSQFFCYFPTFCPIFPHAPLLFLISPISPSFSISMATQRLGYLRIRILTLPPPRALL